MVTDGGYTALNCAQEFTLVLTSDKPSVHIPETKVLTNPCNSPRIQITVEVHTDIYVYPHSIFTIPQTGLWINKRSCSGTGSVTVYTGAGTGESEMRYAMQTWPFVFIIIFNNE